MVLSCILAVNKSQNQKMKQNFIKKHRYKINIFINLNVHFLILFRILQLYLSGFINRFGVYLGKLAEINLSNHIYYGEVFVIKISMLAAFNWSICDTFNDSEVDLMNPFTFQDFVLLGRNEIISMNWLFN